MAYSVAVPEGGQASGDGRVRALEGEAGPAMIARGVGKTFHVPREAHSRVEDERALRRTLTR